MFALAVNAVNGVADDTVATENIQSESSLPHVTAEMAVDFPVGNDSQLRRAILGFIFDRCQEIYEGVEVERPSNSCNAKEFKAFLDNYTSTLCRLSAEDRKECADALADEGDTYEADWFSNLYINKTADTNLYVSYTTYNTDFSGGGHDNRMSEAVTIRKSDGAIISSIFVEDAEEKMQDVLWKYLIASEEPEDPVEYRAEINRFLEANYDCVLRAFARAAHEREVDLARRVHLHCDGLAELRLLAGRAGHSDSLRGGEAFPCQRGGATIGSPPLTPPEGKGIEPFGNTLGCKNE